MGILPLDLKVPDTRTTHKIRTAPILDCGKSPAQLLISKRLRFILYATHRSLQPAPVYPEVTHHRFKKQKKQRRYYDRYSKIRSCISVGAQVLLRKNGGGYQPAIVTEKANTPRSYNAQAKDDAAVPTHQATPQQDTLQRRLASHRHTQSPAVQSPRCAGTTRDICDGYIKRDVPGSTRRTTCDGHPCSATREERPTVTVQVWPVYKPTIKYCA